MTHKSSFYLLPKFSRVPLNIHCETDYYAHLLFFCWKPNHATQDTLTDFHGNEANLFYFFEKKSKIANPKKLSFSILPILNIFFSKSSWIGCWVNRID